MAGFLALWQLIPPSLQPFFITGPCGFLFFGWIFLTLRNMKTAEDIQKDLWEVQQNARQRAEIDRKGARITELEEQISSLRRAYEATIDRIRHECETEIHSLSKDRLRGWDLARAWHEKSYVLWHALITTILLVPLELRPALPDPLGQLEDREGISADRSVQR